MSLTLPVSRTAIGATPATGPLRVSTVNPRYFADSSGKAVYLTGSHTWRNVQDSANVPDFTAYLDFLKKYGHNYTRLWVHRGSPGGPALTPTIYARTGPGTALDGGPKYDLTKFDQAFFDQLRARCIAARDRGIYVQVMLDSSETARVEWIHPVEGAITSAESVAGGGKRVLKAPFNGAAAAHLWMAATAGPAQAVERNKQ